MRALQQQVEAGQPFAVSLRQRTSCPGLLVELLMAGETTGTLDAMMEKAAAFAAADVRHRSARVEALAEPIMIFFVGALIFFFVLSIVLPLLTTMDALM
ncbi:type II secretion system F family protein [uncultured Mitsuokella sp.]|nr:type II secretion system F family protein [uncultured Mitsuokella sp.]